MYKNVIKIGHRKIGAEYPPFIIAEMSGNHNQSLKRALAIVEAAARAGCDALKIQTYTADTMTIRVKRKEFFIEDKKSLWKGFYLHDLYKKAFTPWEWHKAIFTRCKELGMIGFSTPFDESAVDFLESLKIPAYKIASFENNHLPLISKVAKTGKPLIMSTGMATREELDLAVKTARQSGCKDLILLKCTSAYPSLPQDANLLTIPDIAKRFDCVVGISDHTLGVGVAVASVALGARVIEKHFTLRRNDGGVDAAFSLEPQEMKELVEESKKAFYGMGKVSYGRTDAEKKSLRFRRSIFTVEDILAGERFTEKNIRIIRPGNGMAPRYLNDILGKKAKKKIVRGTPLQWKHVR